jgi:hypothetical protein
MRSSTRRTTLTAAVIAGLVIGAATPATAAPPTKFSYKDKFLSLTSPGCEDGEGSCQSLFVSQSKRSSFVCVDVLDAQGAMFGCTDTPTGAFSVTRTTQTLRPTTVTLVRVECDDMEEECDVVGEQEATVSASATTTGRATRHSFRFSERTKDCVARSSMAVRAAPTAGQVTLDGTRYRTAGETGTSTVREFVRGCDFG